MWYRKKLMLIKSTVILSEVHFDEGEMNVVEGSGEIFRDPSTTQFSQHRGRCWENCSAQDDMLKI
jgi:hypothetical protein